MATITGPYIMVQIRSLHKSPPFWEQYFKTNYHVQAVLRLDTKLLLQGLSPRAATDEAGMGYGPQMGHCTGIGAPATNLLLSGCEGVNTRTTRQLRST